MPYLGPIIFIRNKTWLIKVNYKNHSQKSRQCGSTTCWAKTRCRPAASLNKCLCTSMPWSSIRRKSRNQAQMTKISQVTRRFTRKLILKPLLRMRAMSIQIQNLGVGTQAIAVKTMLVKKRKASLGRPVLPSSSCHLPIRLSRKLSTGRSRLSRKVPL